MRRFVIGASTAAVTIALLAAPALAAPALAAAGDVPDAPPDATMPGAALVGKILGWLKWGALAAAVIGILGGAIAAGVGHFGGNFGASSAARKWILGGAAAAVVAGMAHSIATQLYGAV
jgi:hypothetical protein